MLSTNTNTTPSPKTSTPMRIVCFGSNFFGQLGEERGQHCAPYEPRDLPVPDVGEILDVQCGGQFTVIATQTGQVLVTGTINGTVFPTPTPVPIPLPLCAVQIACGRKHTLVLLEQGLVVSWGTGYFGQLGHDDDASLDFPRLISYLEPQNLGAEVEQVFCGGSHSGALTRTGQLFMWGLNRNGQCGISSKADSVLRPRPVVVSELHSEAIVDVCCGRNHSALLTSRGNVYTWGASGYGRLGHADMRKRVSVPLLVEALTDTPIQQIASGDMHMLALDSEGEVYSWGYSAEGQCGHGTTLHYRTPRRIDFFSDIHISWLGCGSTYSFAVSGFGELFVWGYGDGGWLGLNPDSMSGIPYIEADNEPSRVTYDRVCSFESRLNVLRPEKLSFEDALVIKVRAGGAHTVVFLGDKSETHPHIPLESDHSNGTDPHIRTSETWCTPEGIEDILSLCRDNCIAPLEECLVQGMPADVRDENDNTMLLIACQNGHVKMAKLLLARGADINAVNNRGNTCLHYCFAYGFNELGDWLIQQGADEFRVNSEGLTCYEGLTLADLDKFDK